MGGSYICRIYGGRGDTPSSGHLDGEGDPISAGNLDLWESISAGNLHRGIPSLQETQMGGGGGGSHICRKPR